MLLAQYKTKTNENVGTFKDLVLSLVTRTVDSPERAGTLLKYLVDTQTLKEMHSWQAL
jgi:hypothetical protein